MDRVKALIAIGEDVNARPPGSNTALMWAAFKRNEECIKALIAANADVNAKNKYDETALMAVATWGNADCVKALIAAHADVNAKMKFGITALERAVCGKKSWSNGVTSYGVPTTTDSVEIAAGAGNVDCVKALIDAGAKANTKDDGNYTALMWAANRGQSDCVKALIDAGADVNAKMKYGLTVLEMAVCGTTRCDWNYAGSSESEIIPAGAGNVDCITALIVAHVNVNEKDNGGCTALMIAATAGKADCVKALVAAGADVNANDNYGDTAIEYAVYGERGWGYRFGKSTMTFSASGGIMDSIKALIAAGADVNAKDKQGVTALMSAAFIGDPDIVKALIAARADINAQDIQGETPLMKAATLYGNVDCVKAIIAAGADLNAKDNTGKTALARAMSRDMAAVLRAAGAKD